MGPTFQPVQISRSPDDPFWKREEKEGGEGGEGGRPNSRRCLRRPCRSILSFLRDAFVSRL